jgi:hypothetical protein
MSALYDFKADVLTDTIKIETTGKQTKIVKLPLKVHKIAAITPSDDDEPKEQKRQIGFNVLKNNDATKIVGGANNDTENAQNNAITKIVGGTETTGQCPNCLKSFIKNHKKHTYCQDECRIEFWQKSNNKKVHKNKTGKN